MLKQVKVLLPIKNFLVSKPLAKNVENPNHTKNSNYRKTEDSFLWTYISHLKFLSPPTFNCFTKGKSSKKGSAFISDKYTSFKFLT